MESPDREWLKTPDGRKWLVSDEGGAWLRTEDGWAWMHSRDAREWFEELSRKGWERFFAGEMPPPPQWAITPAIAPRIGDRIRLREAVTSSNGTRSVDGEVIVVGLDFVPIGMVLVEARARDGRVFTTMTRDSFVPLT